jgi:hypothetical protein
VFPRMTQFDASTTADDVLAGVDLAGRLAIVTGGASGIVWVPKRTVTSCGLRVFVDETAESILSQDPDVVVWSGSG